jgi:hypothetical protein
MKRIFFSIIISLLSFFLMAEAGIGIVSSNTGKTYIFRNQKIVKFAMGQIIQNNDEIRTSGKSDVGFSFVDGTTSLKVLSETTVSLSLNKTPAGMGKTVQLSQGSILVRTDQKNDLFTMKVGNCSVNAVEADFLVKVTLGKDICIIVLKGSVELITSPDIPSEIVDMGKSAYIDPEGKSSIRQSGNDELTEEEELIVFPTRKANNQTILIPVQNKQGLVKLIELSW